MRIVRKRISRVSFLGRRGRLPSIIGLWGHWRESCLLQKWVCAFRGRVGRWKDREDRFASAVYQVVSRMRKILVRGSEAAYLRLWRLGVLQLETPKN